MRDGLAAERSAGPLLTAYAKRLCARIRTAAKAHEPLLLHGRETKSHLGTRASGNPFDLSPYRGVISYEPAEQVITAFAGTPVVDVEQVLAAEGQMFGFEAPHFGGRATLGGMVAAGISGPRRPYAGAVRDVVLGATLVDGRGEFLRFGGQVIKNVAGYDISRLLAGSWGILGPILTLSLRVVPVPRAECSVSWQLDEAPAVARMTALQGQPLPLSGLAWDGSLLRARFSGAEAAVTAAIEATKPDDTSTVLDWWQALREHDLPWFARAGRLWRLSVPPASPPLPLADACFYDWGGAQRWLISEQEPAEIRAVAGAHGGWAQAYFEQDKYESTPLQPAILALHQRLKRVFDPHGIFNVGRMHPEL